MGIRIIMAKNFQIHVHQQNELNKLQYRHKPECNSVIDSELDLYGMVWTYKIFAIYH